MASIPSKSPYRVVAVGASYLDHVETILPDGSEGVVPVYKVGRFRETINLTDNQARRLQALGVVKPADAPKGYHEQDQEALQKLVDERPEITVVGSGANGEVLHTDLINALENHDRAVNTRESALAAAEVEAPDTDVDASAGGARKRAAGKSAE